MALRFMNIEKHVDIKPTIHFIYNFKPVLEQLSRAESTQELGHIAQTFFKESFNIPVQNTNLFICEPKKKCTYQSH